ncbi:MAG: hypothetical protein M0Z84_02910 [Gammaproteobacteria bacterium]|nr:hypothetical protein [Gammaproteobacteria bacterium]
MNNKLIIRSVGIATAVLVASFALSACGGGGGGSGASATSSTPVTCGSGTQSNGNGTCVLDAYETLLNNNNHWACTDPNGYWGELEFYAPVGAYIGTGKISVGSGGTVSSYSWQAGPVNAMYMSGSLYILSLTNITPNALLNTTSFTATENTPSGSGGGGTINCTIATGTF